MIRVWDIKPSDPLLKDVKRVEESTELHLGTWFNEPAMAWGVIPDSCLSDNYYLWSHAWPRTLRKFRREFLVFSRQIVDDLRSRYPLLYGVTKQETSWLKHLGVEFGPPYEGWDTFIIRGR